MPAPRIDVSCLTWEGQQFQGKAAILEKLSSLPFQKIQHSITVEDCQPTPSICTISIVVGQLKADEDLHHGVPSDVPVKEYRWCLGLHQWHAQACPAQLWLTSSQPGTHAVSSSLLFPILFTSFQMLQMSFTNEQGCSGHGCSVLLLPRCCAWGLDTRIVASDRRSLCCASACLGKT